MRTVQSADRPAAHQYRQRATWCSHRGPQQRHGWYDDERSSFGILHALERPGILFQLLLDCLQTRAPAASRALGLAASRALGLIQGNNMCMAALATATSASPCALGLAVEEGEHLVASLAYLDYEVRCQTRGCSSKR